MVTIFGGPRAAFVQDFIAASRTMWKTEQGEKSLGVLSSGSSGDPKSPYWSDHIPVWPAGDFFKF